MQKVIRGCDNELACEKGWLPTSKDGNDLGFRGLYGIVATPAWCHKSMLPRKQPLVKKIIV